MDQEKIGTFIAQMRKDQGLTQKQLADQLDISNKTVSKWETGKGMPDISLMLPLCEALKININELLSGEKLNDTQYHENAERNMMSLIQEQESKKRILVAAVICMLAVGIAFWLLSMFEIRMEFVFILFGFTGLLIGVIWLREKTKHKDTRLGAPIVLTGAGGMILAVAITMLAFV